MDMIILASSGLAPWGQAAAIVLGIYLFLSILVGLGLAVALLFAFSWLREKSELIKKLRPTIDQTNRALVATQHGEPLPTEVADNKIVQIVTRVPIVVATLPGRVSAVDQKIEHGSDRVAGAVIEFHARTEMVKGIARAFFLPGLTRSHRAFSEEKVAATVAQDQATSRSSETNAAEEAPLEKEIVIVQSSH
jgi:hypothetical protein